MKSIVILISGRGSNMEAIFDAIAEAGLAIEIRAVISNRPDSKGLKSAIQRGVPAVGLDHKTYRSREAFDLALAKTIAPFTPDYVVLAGFMRVLSAGFIGLYENRIINIHPSLLPAFPGLHTHEQALKAGVKIHGATVHFVSPALDHGPIIVQAAVPVLPGDDPLSLAARVLASEHRIYPQALRWLSEGRVELKDGVVRIRDLDVLSGNEIQPMLVPRENK